MSDELLLEFIGHLLLSFKIISRREVSNLSVFAGKEVIYPEDTVVR